MKHFTNISTQAAEFLIALHSLSLLNQRMLLGTLMEEMEHGLINEENSTDYCNVFEPGPTVLTPEKIGLDDGSVLASESFAGLSTAETGMQSSPPAGYFLDVARSHIEINQEVYRVQGIFYSLPYLDKLYALAELFALIETAESEIKLQGLDAFAIAYNIHRFIQEYCEEAGIPQEAELTF